MEGNRVGDAGSLHRYCNMRQTAWVPVSSKQRQFVLRYWTGWQQVHEHLVKETEVSLTVLPAGGSRVTYRH